VPLPYCRWQGGRPGHEGVPMELPVRGAADQDPALWFAQPVGDGSSPDEASEDPVCRAPIPMRPAVPGAFPEMCSAGFHRGAEIRRMTFWSCRGATVDQDESPPFGQRGVCRPGREGPTMSGSIRHPGRPGPRASMHVAPVDGGTLSPGQLLPPVDVPGSQSMA